LTVDAEHEVPGLHSEAVDTDHDRLAVAEGNRHARLLIRSRHDVVVAGQLGSAAGSQADADDRVEVRALGAELVDAALAHRVDEHGVRCAAAAVAALRAAQQVRSARRGAAHAAEEDPGEIAGIGAEGKRAISVDAQDIVTALCSEAIDDDLYHLTGRQGQAHARETVDSNLDVVVARQLGAAL
jgi:predicted Fe-Mo cluster-binding NifX family protein